MTVKDLRTLVDNLDEYIHVPGGIERLKKTILHLAVSGQLVPQDSSEGTGQELYDQIQVEKDKLLSEGKIKKQKPLPGIMNSEVPFDIPSNWKWTRLGEITQKIGSGSTPRGGKSVYTVEGPVFLRSQNIWNDGLRLEKVVHINIETYEKMSNTFVLPNDVLLNITGASIGRTSIVPNDLGRSNVSQHVSIVRPVLYEQSTMIHLVFISSYFQRLIDDVQSGVSREGLSKQKMEKMLVPLPPLREQDRITKKVKTIFELVDKLAERHVAEQSERKRLVASSLSKLSEGESSLALDMLAEIIKTKEDTAELRKTILHLAVSGQLVPQDSSEGNGDSLRQEIQSKRQKLVSEGKLKKQTPLAEIAETEIPFEIPISWEWVRPADVGQINPRNQVADELPVGFIPMTLISEQYGATPKHEIRNWGTVKKSFTHFADDDVVLAKITPCFENSKAGIIAGMPNGIGAGTTELHVFRQLPSLIDPGFVYLWFKSPYYLAHGRTKMTGTAGQKRVSTTYFSSFPMPLPSTKEQVRIVQKTTHILNLITRLEQHLEVR